MRGESSQRRQEDVPGIPKKLKSRWFVNPVCRETFKIRKGYTVSMVTVKNDQVFLVGWRESPVGRVLTVHHEDFKFGCQHPSWFLGNMSITSVLDWGRLGACRDKQILWV